MEKKVHTSIVGNYSPGVAHLALIVVSLVVGIIIVGGITITNSLKDKSLQQTFDEVVDSVVEQQPVTIPQDILNNKFGFPSGGPEDVDIYGQFGIAWVRPHPGPFQWGHMQESANSEISFETTDRYIKGYQDAGFGVQVTLFPFADWDQEKRSDYKNCLVSTKDIMYQPPPPEDGELMDKKDGKPLGDLKKDFSYAEEEPKDKSIFKIGKESVDTEAFFIPQSRCNPYDWDGYLAWVEKVVERYDGDGVDDMIGLKIPVKYWEVLNEPDLNANHLDFYNGTPEDYAELLVRTSETIRKSDPDANILIAGAAGGNKYFLDFYRGVFKNIDARSAFDMGNVHCISNDDYDTYNVEPYQKMLAEFDIDVPVWVTEAEALMSLDRDINASQTYQSTVNALELGAEKIFFSHQKFDRGMDMPGLPESQLTISDYKVQLDGSDPVGAFEEITSLGN